MAVGASGLGVGFALGLGEGPNVGLYMSDGSFVGVAVGASGVGLGVGFALGLSEGPDVGLDLHMVRWILGWHGCWSVGRRRRLRTRLGRGAGRWAISWILRRR